MANGQRRQAAKFDAAGLVKSLSRHEFICRFVARMTQRSEGRILTNGYYVAETKEGWVYGYKSSISDVVMCRPTTPENLYDVIRRECLNHYVREAEDFRIDVLLAEQRSAEFAQ